MADLEDSLAPSWANVVAGHANLRDAVRRDLTLTDPASGKRYARGPGRGRLRQLVRCRPAIHAAPRTDDCAVVDADLDRRACAEEVVGSARRTTCGAHPIP
jgi:malate synthase